MLLCMDVGVGLSPCLAPEWLTPETTGYKTLPSLSGSPLQSEPCTDVNGNVNCKAWLIQAYLLLLGVFHHVLRLRACLHGTVQCHIEILDLANSVP